MQLLTIFAALGALAAPALSLQQEYHYFTGDLEMKIANHSRPITISGVAIHPTELNASDTGAQHAVADGHHFGHKGWVLAGTGASDVHWEFVPRILNRSSAPSLKKRTDEYFSFLDLVENDAPSGVDHIYYGLDVATDNAMYFQEEFGFFSAQQIDWDMTLDAVLDFIIDGGGDVFSSILDSALDNLFAIGWDIIF